MIGKGINFNEDQTSNFKAQTAVFLSLPHGIRKNPQQRTGAAFQESLPGNADQNSSAGNLGNVYPGNDLFSLL